MDGQNNVHFNCSVVLLQVLTRNVCVVMNIEYLVLYAISIFLQYMECSESERWCRELALQRLEELIWERIS